MRQVDKVRRQCVDLVARICGSDRQGHGQRNHKLAALDSGSEL